MIRKAWWLTEGWGDHCLSDICFKIFIWKCLKFYNARANVIFQIISCNLPKLCCALLEPGENGDVEFPSPLHICLSWHLLEDGIPQWFHTKVSQVDRGIRRDECPPPNEGHSFAPQGKWIFFTNWQGRFGNQENANNKKCLKKMTTKSVEMYVLLLSFETHSLVKLFE